MSDLPDVERLRALAEQADLNLTNVAELDPAYVEGWRDAVSTITARIEAAREAIEASALFAGEAPYNEEAWALRHDVLSALRGCPS